MNGVFTTNWYLHKAYSTVSARTEVRTVAISVLEFLDLCAWENIGIYCEICKKNMPHKPIEQIGEGKTIEKEDAYVVSCVKCGNHVVARYVGKT